MPYTNGIVTYTEISSASRGAYRPTWELLYAHYAQIKGVDAPWTEQYKNYTVKSMGGFEGGTGSWGEGSGHYDGLGWGSLLYHLDADDVAALSRASTFSSIPPPVTSTASASSSNLTASPSSASTSTATTPPATHTASAPVSDPTASPSSFTVSTIPTSSVAPIGESSISYFSSSVVPTSTADSIVLSTSDTTPTYTTLITSTVRFGANVGSQQTVYVYSCE